MNLEEKTSKKIKKPWPTKAAMKQIYEEKLWGGGGDFDFYSGDGSHKGEIIEPYIGAVSSFLRSFENPLVVCDLGCGDFNVGKEFVKYSKKYIGVDIVPDLIKYNVQKFKAPNLEFRCLDIAVDDLPTGDCVILRQVLQHLSNAEVENIVGKLANFKYAIVTEHIPEGDFTPNKDIISGQGIRLKKQSGVNLLAPPFNFKIKAEKQLVKFSLNAGKGAIATTLYTI